MSVHCIVSLITLCYALPQYTLHPDSCLSCSAPWWQLGLSLASEEKRFFKLEFKFSNSKYFLASGRNIKVVKFGTIFFSNLQSETLLSHLLESSTSLSFSILQSFNSFGESSHCGELFLSEFPPNHLSSHFDFEVLSSPFSREVLKQLFPLPHLERF